MRNTMSGKSAPVILGILSFVVIVVLWEAVVRLGWVNPFFVSRPSLIVAASLIQQAQSGEVAA